MQKKPPQKEKFISPFSCHDSELPLELIRCILDYLDLRELAKLATVSSSTHSYVSAYFFYMRTSEERMRQEIISQKQKTIKETEKYIKSLENDIEFSLRESLIVFSLFMSIFFLIAKQFPDEFQMSFTLFAFFLTFILTATIHYSKPRGYEFHKTIASLSNRHKQQYLQLPPDTRKKMLLKFKATRAFLLKPKDVGFEKYLPIHRLRSMLEEIIGDLKAETITIQKYPETFKLLDPKKSAKEQDPSVTEQFNSHLPIFPVSMMRNFQKCFIACQRKENQGGTPDDLIHNAMCKGNS